MNKRRLLKLADLLEEDAANKKGVKFDLGTVGEASDWRVEKFEPGLNCGTIACAMGLAAISGAFKRAGLSYRVRDQDIETTIKRRRISYVIAAIKIFEIDEPAAHFLFTPGNYGSDHPQGARGERRVAKRIRDFVAGKVSPCSIS